METIRLSGKYGGILGALIFFCFLFFYQEKKRKWRLEDNAPNYTIDNDD